MENGVPQGWTYHNLTQLTTWMYWFLKITTFEKRYYIWAHSTKWGDHPTKRVGLKWPSQAPLQNLVNPSNQKRKSFFAAAASWMWRIQTPRLPPHLPWRLAVKVESSSLFDSHSSWTPLSRHSSCPVCRQTLAIVEEEEVGDHGGDEALDDDDTNE